MVDGCDMRSWHGERVELKAWRTWKLFRTRLEGGSDLGSKEKRLRVLPGTDKAQSKVQKYELVLDMVFLQFFRRALSRRGLGSSGSYLFYFCIIQWRVHATFHYYYFVLTIHFSGLSLFLHDNENCPFPPSLPIIFFLHFHSMLFLWDVPASRPSVILTSQKNRLIWHL